MVSIATAAFTLDKWEPQSTDETAGVEFSRVLIAKTFIGEIEGTSTVEMLAAGNEISRAYVAFERFDVAVQGRKGTFVLHHSASDAGASWTILTGSGTGELTGISGVAEIVNDDGGHTFTLTYEGL
ncbi:DUF3224 domain-containing protein [Amycolatopsis sp.]|jgi:hypothetical protein|uniref:DUF3224 domain-containing protein n=1 Tax=Amycolatopsis sp. TaxID=37632 RepID=UPI002DF88EDC|nr:DUF3224 domain-containing protein [Amycolatopsis sp.]